MNFQGNPASDTQPARLNTLNKGLVNAAVRQSAMRPLLAALMLAMLACVPVVGFAADFDGDGRNDFYDKDDDNDGILDTEEGCHTIYTGGYTNYDRWTDLGAAPTIHINNSTDDELQILDGIQGDGAFMANAADNLVIDLGHVVPAGTRVWLTLKARYYFNGTVELYKYVVGTGATGASFINYSIDLGLEGSGEPVNGDWTTVPHFLAEDTQYVIITIPGRTVGNMLFDYFGVAEHFIGGPDADADGLVNCIDLDSDGDGITDNVEAQTTAGYIAPGTFTDTDSQGDAGYGINDVYGAGLTPVNTDSDAPAYPDYLDTNSDNDLKADMEENGVANTASGTDADNDGIDDVFDIDDTNWGNTTSHLPNNGMDSPDTDLPPTSASTEADYRDALDYSDQVLACEPVGYMVKSTGSLWTTLDFVDGISLTTDDNFPTQINGIGYNPTDNAIWGYDNGPVGDDGRDGQLTRTVKNANGDWVTTLTDVIPGLPTNAYPIGDVSDAGILYLKSGNTIQTVDVNPASATYLQHLGAQTLTYNFTFSTTVEVATDAKGDACPTENPPDGFVRDAGVVYWDYAFHPDFPDLLFAVSVDGTCKNPFQAVPHLYSIDVTSGDVNDLGPAGIDPPNTILADGNIRNAGLFGAAFFDADGFLYISDNMEENDDDGNQVVDLTTGQDDAPIFRIDLTGGSIPANYDETKSVKFSEGPPSGGKNDGAMCRGAAIYIDFGDAPDSYGTSLAANGARHEMRVYDPDTFTSDLMLGTNVGREVDGIADNTAAVDDSALGGEDGVTFTVGGTAGARTIKASVQYTTSNIAGALWAWMAVVDGSGAPATTFVLAQRQGVGFNTQGSGGSHVFEWSVPDVAGSTYVRFRICSEVQGSNVGACDTPTGPAADGEVEDYKVSFDLSLTAVTIGGVELKSAAASDFLGGIGVGDMDAEALRGLLVTWDPDLATALAGAGREALLQALADYLDPDGDGVVALLRWDTLEQTGTIGFFVEREQSNGDWKRINGHMLPAILAAPMGAEYWLADPGALLGESYSYRLIEQEATGTTNSYGPFNVEMPR
jgi:hypothetical protein